MKRGFDWEAGTYLENSQRQLKSKLEAFEKETKEKVHQIVGEIIKDSGLSDKNKNNVEKHVFRVVWIYHTNLKRNKKPKPSLRGTPLDLTIKAVLYNALISQELAEHHNEIVYLIKKFPSFSDYNEIMEKANFLAKCEDPENYYNMDDIDKVRNKYKEESFRQLFKSGNNWPYMVDGLRIYSTMFGGRGYFTAVKIVRRLKGKSRNKVRKGLCGACSYVLTEEYQTKEDKFRPNLSHSAWAEIFEMDRETFKKRVDFVKAHLLPGDYVTSLDFDLMLLPAFL